jgi:hypothetical protein
MARQKIYYHTQDVALAYALVQAGEQFKGLKNVYDDKKLRQLGCESVREAFEKNKHGQVFFFFVDSESLRKVEKGFREKEAEIGRKEYKPEDLPIEPEQFGRLACGLLSDLKPFQTLWTKYPGLYAQPGDTRTDFDPDMPKYIGSTEKFGQKTITGATFISHKASAATKEAMGV